jgi:hypothetical protein
MTLSTLGYPLGKFSNPAMFWLLALDTIGKNEGQILPNYKDNNYESLEEKIEDLRNSFGPPDCKMLQLQISFS